TKRYQKARCAYGMAQHDVAHIDDVAAAAPPFPFAVAIDRLVLAYRLQHGRLGELAQRRPEGLFERLADHRAAAQSKLLLGMAIDREQAPIGRSEDEQADRQVLDQHVEELAFVAERRWLRHVDASGLGCVIARRDRIELNAQQLEHA